MNETIELMMKHRSVRKFKPDPVSDEQLAAIVSAGQMASSSSSVQAYTVIAVTDLAQKAKLAELAGNQAYVNECPVFLVWCADLYRLSDAAKRHLPEKESYADSTENFMVATIDAALASQNAALAAESLGFGIVYIGGFVLGLRKLLSCWNCRKGYIRCMACVLVLQIRKREFARVCHLMQFCIVIVIMPSRASKVLSSMMRQRRRT